MSIADKLTTIAENEPKVYKAGQIAMLKNSKYMNATKSGSIITANDVSPIEHNLGVKLSSDTITDFSSVKVTRCGKNIFDADTVLPSFYNPSYPGIHWKKQEDGSWYVTNSGIFQKSKWFENTNGYVGQMVISASVKLPEGKEGDNSFTLVFRYTDGTSKPLRFYHSEDFVISTLVSDAGKTIAYIDQSYNNTSAIYIKDIMIAYGTDTEYEPYNPYTVTANADGTVDLTSISPNMTLFTDTDGVSINCQYYRDIDRYIDNLIGNVVLSGGE